MSTKIQKRFNMKTFGGRLQAAIVDAQYCVTIDDWHKEQVFAEYAVATLEDYVKYSSRHTVELGSCKLPNHYYLNEIVYRFMKERYGWNEAKDYRKWCRENPDQILTVEVFGEPDEDSPVALYMRYDSKCKRFEFKLC